MCVFFRNRTLDFCVAVVMLYEIWDEQENTKGQEDSQRYKSNNS